MAEGTTLGKAWVQIVPSAKGISGSIARLLNGEATSAGTSAGNAAGSSMVSAIKGVIAAAGIGAAVKSSLTAGMNFDSEMAHVAAISGATGEAFDTLRTKALELGASTKFSASESAEAFKYMAMAGWDVGQMMSGVDGILSLAAADGLDLASTSDIVTDALTAFGLSASDSSHFADVLAVASSSANTNVALMGETFKYVAPLAGSLKLTAEDVAQAVGLMANAGIKASQAGTALRSGLTRLVSPTNDMIPLMKKLGLAVSELSEEEAKAKIKALEASVTAREKAYDAEEDALRESLDKQYDTLKNSLEEEYNAKEKTWDKEISALEAAQEKELSDTQKAQESVVREYEKATEAKLALIDKEYQESLKNTDKAEYDRLKALDEQIAEIEAASKAASKAAEEQERAQRRAELQKAIDSAKSTEARIEAERKLTDYNETIRRKDEESARKARIADLKAQKDAVKEQAKAERDAAKDKRDAEAKAYKEERAEGLEALKGRHKDELAELKRAQKETLEEKKDARKTDLEELKKANNDALTEIKKGNDKQLKALKTSNKEKLSAYQDYVKEQKKAFESAAKSVQSLVLTDEKGNMRTLNESVGLLREAFSGLSSAEQAEAASTLFGQEAMSGWLAMLNASEKSVNDLANAVNHADGAAERMAGIMQNTLGGTDTSFKSAVEGLQIAVYDKFSGTLTDIVNLARDFVSNITTGVITGDWSPLMEFVGGLAAKLYQNFRAALEQAGLLEGFDALIQTVSTIFTGVSETVARVFPEVAATVENALERIRTATAPAVEFISALLSGFATYVHSGQAAADVTNILSTAVEFLGGVIGTAAEIVAVIVEKTADFITWLSEGSTGADLFAAAVAGIVGAFAAFQIALGVHALIGTFAKAIEGAKLAFAAFNAVMAANPLLLVATLIGGVAAALLTLWHTNEGFRDAVIKIYETAVNFVTRKVDNVIELFTVTIPNALTWLREFVSQVAAEILAFFTGLWDGIITTFSNIGQWFGERFTEAYNAVTGAWNAVGKWFGDRWTDISNAFTGAQKWFSDTFTAAWKGVTDVFDDVKTFFEGVWSNITGVFTGAIEWFRNLGQNIVKGLKEGIGGLWDGFLSLLGLKTEEVKETFTGADGFDTHSPSKVFARIGRDVVFGLRDGVNKSSGQAVSAMESTISGIVAAGQSVNSSALFPSAVEAVERTRNLLRVSPETHFPGFAPQILRDNPAQTFRPAPVNITMVNEVGGERYERRQYQYRDAETARRGPSFVKT